ncbi:hypothetical protein HK096_006859, partial [Nowakowskiella sp. JEL0078]
TKFTVDAFNYGMISNCEFYFLSHFHSDHYGGLTSKFSFGKILCSEITSKLVIQQLRVRPEFIQVLPMNIPTDVDGVQVTLVDANHCPGAVLFLFEFLVPPFLRYLHTGDFRASPQHITHPSISANPCFDLLFLDTTYCKPQYSFPPQPIVLNVLFEFAQRICAGEKIETLCCTSRKKKAKFEDNGEREGIKRWMASSPVAAKKSATISAWENVFNQKSKEVLFLVGSYLIGKEKVFVGIAKAIGSKVFADTPKRKILSCLMDPEIDNLITNNANEADVHVVSMGHLNKDAVYDKINSLKTSYKSVIIVRPTGWTYKELPKNQTVEKIQTFEHVDENEKEYFSRTDVVDNDFTVSSLKATYFDFSTASTTLPKTIAVIGVPYSEHSSYLELKQFVLGLKSVKKIVPTVGGSNEDGRAEMEREFMLWEQERANNLNDK